METKAKRDWYKLQDRNKIYFHNCASQRRTKNTIKHVFDANNRSLTSRDEVERAFNFYFEKLYASNGPSLEDIESCLREVEPRVIVEMNEFLIRCFTTSEVEEAIKQMAPLKSPEPDGFGACFYQSHWSIIGNEVCTSVRSFLNGNTFNPSLHYTFITLIPKVKTPKIVSEYRPINLCNVLYKII